VVAPLTALVMAVTATVVAVPVSGAETGSISGRVVDERTGEPLAGVCAGLRDDPSLVAPTGADGRYRIDGIDLLLWPIAVVFNLCDEPLPGYAAEMRWNVEVAAGQPTSGIDAALGPAARIAGRVTDELDGSPVGDVPVWALAAEPGGFDIFGQRTDASGRYELANLPSGGYLLEFAGDQMGVYLAEVYDDVRRSPWTWDTEVDPAVVWVEANRPATVIDVELEPGGAIAGRVWAAHVGAPIWDFRLELWDSGVEPAPAAPLGEPRAPLPPVEQWHGSGGRYQTSPVPAGRYRLHFSNWGYEPRWWPGTGSYGEAAEVLVSPRQVVEGVDITLRPVLERLDCPSPPYPPSSPFVDVGPGVHEHAIRCLALEQVLAGVDPEHFAPAATARRDQVASVLVRTLIGLGVTVPADALDAFVDDAGNVHEASMNQLADMGVLTGTGSGHVRPGDPVTRAQMATLLVRAWKAAGVPELRSLGDAFTDDTGNSHESAIDRAAAAALIVGIDGQAYRPGDHLRRDQLASLIFRFRARVHWDGYAMRDVQLFPWLAGSPAMPEP
jgi:hypothetical protein